MNDEAGTYYKDIIDDFTVGKNLFLELKILVLSIDYSQSNLNLNYL